MASRALLLLAAVLCAVGVNAGREPSDKGYDAYYKPKANWVADPLPPPPPPASRAFNTTGCQTVQQVLAAFNLTTLATAAKKAGLEDLLYAPGNTVFVPLESGVYRVSATGHTTAFTAPALLRGSSKKYLRDVADFVQMSVVPGGLAVRDMHDAQRLDTSLDGVALEVKLPSPNDYSNVLILGPYDHMHALVARRDVATCGGGYVQVLDALLLPHPM